MHSSDVEECEKGGTEDVDGLEVEGDGWGNLGEFGLGLGFEVAWVFSHFFPSPS